MSDIMRPMFEIRRWSVALTLFTLVTQAAAVDCVFEGLDETARVVRRSGEVLAPYPGPMTDRNCEGLKVASGKVGVYAMNADKTQVIKSTVNTGRNLLPRDAGPDAADSSFGRVFSALSMLIAGSQRQIQGSSRGDTSDFVTAVLPVGRVAKPSADVLLPLGPTVDPLLKSFVLRAGARELHRQTGPAAHLLLPLAVMVEGSRIHWALDYADNLSSGEFVVASASALAEARTRLSSENASEPDVMLRQLRIAMGLTALGWHWDSRAELARGWVR